MLLLKTSSATARANNTPSTPAADGGTAMLVDDDDDDDDDDGTAVSPASQSTPSRPTGGIRNFFQRKRHKSVTIGFVLLASFYASAHK